MNKIEAIKDLVKQDHIFLFTKRAEELTKPFGIKPKLREMKDTRSFFKGLTLHGKNPKTGKEYVEGDTAMGIDSHLLAGQIARHLKVEYDEHFGIGSQLREICGKILKFLEKGK